MNKFSPLPVLIFLMLSSFNACVQEVKVKGKVMDGKCETRVGALAFTYRFGGFKEKSTENGSRREGGDDGDDF